MSKKRSDNVLIGTLIVAVAGVLIGGTGLVVWRIQQINQEQVSAVAAVEEAMASPHAGNLRLGEKFPDFTLPAGEAGGEFRFASVLDGEHYVVVNFHHPDCPCAANCGQLINEMTGDETYADVRFVGIMASDTRSDRVLEALAEQIADGVVTFPVYMDHDQEVKRLLGARRTPEVWVLDKDGTIAYHGAPESTLAPGTRAHRYLLREAIDALKAGREPEIRRMDSIGCLIEPIS